MRDEDKSREQLLREVADLRRQLAARDGDARFRSLFEESPVPLWEEDLSAAKARLQELRTSEVSDLRAYLTEHPEEVDACARLIRVLDVNQATIALYGASSRGDLLGGLGRFIGAESRAAFVEELVAMAEGRARFATEIANRTLRGETIEVEMVWVAVSGHESALSRVIVSTIDVTGRKRAERELRESENKYRTLLNNIPQRIIYKDRNSVYLAINPAFAQDIGMSPEEVVGKTDYDLTPCDLSDKFRADDRRIMESGVGEEFDEPNFLAGRALEIHTVKVPVRDASGEVVGVLVIFWDVTEQKRAERALRESEERFRAIFEQAAVGIVQTNQRGQFVKTNQRYCEIVGYTSDELARRSFADITYPEDLPESQEKFEQLYRGEIESYSLEKRYVRKDGSIIWASLTVSLVRGADGKPAYSIVIVGDISDRKAVEAERQRLIEEQVEARGRIEELAQFAERRAAELQRVLDDMVEAVIVTNTERRVASVNGAFTQMTGLDASEVVGRSLPEYATALRLRSSGGLPKGADQLTMSRALEGQTVTNEPAIVHNARTGRDVQLRISAAPLRAPDGSIVGAVTVARDVTALTELDRLKDEFLVVAAHELKTPVTIMKGYAQALERASVNLPPPARRMIDAIDHGADRIDRIVKDLLDITRLQAGQLELADERVDLAALAAEVVDRFALTTSKHRVRVVQADPAVVRGDRSRIGEVLADLLDNAVRYSPAGGDVDVAVRVSDGGAIVSVRDQGVGIPREKQSHIFERFYRAHTRTQYDYGGMGVGLYIAREVIARHGGEMWFESEEGKGSAFYFSLPLTGVGAGIAPEVG